MLKVETDAVVSCANTIQTINKSINTKFNNLQRPINRMDSAWNGSASSRAISKFNKIKNDFYQPRYDVLQNYSNFLLQMVGEGYIETEDTNVSLADRFK